MSGSESGIHILVVDDDKDVRDVTLRRLLSLGYRPTGTATCAEALERLSGGGRIDLLLTDVVMPGDMHGLELAKKAQRLRPQIKILFSSGYSDDALQDDGALKGGVNLITKPCRKSELAQKIQEVLAKAD